MVSYTSLKFNKHNTMAKIGVLSCHLNKYNRYCFNVPSPIFNNYNTKKPLCQAVKKGEYEQNFIHKTPF